MTEPTTCRCGGLVLKVVTPLQTEAPGPMHKVLQTTFATLKSFQCRKCHRKSIPSKDMLTAIANWGHVK